MNMNISRTAMVRLNPALVGKTWGGAKLGTPNEDGPIGESWICSERPEGRSIVSTGAAAGMNFDQYLNEIGPKGMGTNTAKMDRFPLLVKIIDTGQPVSIQVHPDDAHAQALGQPYGKEEMWVIINADPHSVAYCGVSRRLTSDEFSQAISSNTVINVLNKVYPKTGDVFNISAGMIHGAEAGVTFCEIQQNSNTTYRVYDYDRTDANGNRRTLHIEQAKEVADLNPHESYSAIGEAEKIAGGTRQLLGQGKCFRTIRYIVQPDSTVNIPLTKSSFANIVILSGDATLTLRDQVEPVTSIQSWFVPAQDEKLTVIAAATGCTFLAVTVPE